MIDSRTGLISREWFLFFQNLFYLAGGGSNDVTLAEVQYPPILGASDIGSTRPELQFDMSSGQISLDPAMDPNVGLYVETLQSLVAASEALAMAPQFVVPPAPQRYLATPFTAQTTVNVVHNFGTFPMIQVVGSTGLVSSPTVDAMMLTSSYLDSVTHNTLNDFTVVFATATTGTIIASGG